MFSSVRIAIRSLLRRPAVVVVAVVSLAVGIGLNSTVFSIVDAVFLRPPAVSDPTSLVEITGYFKDSGHAILDWPDCQAIADQIPALSAVTASMGRGGLWRNGDESVLLLVDAVGDNYFEMLGVKPILGQLPDPKRAASDPEPPLVLTHWLWRERMGGRPDVIGQRIEFRDHVWRIAAVLPPEFRGLSSLGQRHIWITNTAWARYYRYDLGRGSGQYEAIGRLRPGATLQQAQAQLDALAGRIEASDSHVAKGRRLVGSSIAADMRSRLRPGMLVMGVVALVLLVACANVAGVLLAHAESRRREIGLRLSLGASRLDLVRQFLIENALLAAAGAGLGLVVTSWLIKAVPAFAPPSPIPIHFDFLMDYRLLIFTAGCVLVTLLIFGLAPLGYAMRVSVAESIAGARTAGRTRKSALRYAMVSIQVALSVVLVGGAVVFVRALGEAQDIYPGFDTSRPLALIWGSISSRTGKSQDQVYREAMERLQTAGGVEAVTYARHLPLVGSGSGATVSVVPEGSAPDAAAPRVYFNLLGPKFFEVTGARIMSGRPFVDSDHNGGPPVAIVNAEAARRFWPNQNAIGKLLRIKNDAYQVVGIAVDGRISNIHNTVAPTVFLTSSRMPWGETIFIARTKPDPAVLVKELARSVNQVPGLSVYQSTTLRALVKEALYDDWIPTVLGGSLAIVGLLLAAGGLYGAVSHATERRRSEFGVRMAVGARTRDVAGLVVRQAALFCIAGVPIGVALFVAAYRYYGATLLHDRPLDLFAIAAGAVIAVTAVLGGAVLPAIRASRLDPVEVLRAE